VGFPLSITYGTKDTEVLFGKAGSANISSIPATRMGARGDRQRLQKQRRAIVFARVEFVSRFAHCRVTLIRSDCSSDTADTVRKVTGSLVFCQNFRKACKEVVRWSLGVPWSKLIISLGFDEDWPQRRSTIPLSK
jgi:hypothetical protein